MKIILDDAEVAFPVMYVLCGTCKNYKGKYKCKAFPKGIPKEITSGKFKHDKPYKGDHGIRYEKEKD